MGILILCSSAAVGGGGGDNDGLIVTDYANYDPDDAQIISLDINNTLPNWGTDGGAAVTFSTADWWNGSGVEIVDLFPPTIEESSGIGSIDLWKSATKTVRQLNIRFEWQPTSMFCDDATNLPKLIIVNTYSQLQAVPSVSAERPMFYLAHMIEATASPPDTPDCLVLCPAQGTTRMWSLTNLVPGPTVDDWVDGGNGPATYVSMRQPLYWRATSGTDGAGNPIIAASEVVCIEMRVNVMSTTDEPDGIIAMRIYRRDGSVIERGCAWTWETGHTVDTNYISDIQQMGGGYYNVGNASDANKRTRMGRRLTIGTNLQPTVGRAWIGPPQGFVI